MKEKKDFYIGWQNEMPKAHKAYMKRSVILFYIAIPLLALAFVLFQKPFNDHHFELGQQREVIGIYYDSPFPIVVADEGNLPEGLSREILLVGYGKFGAKSIMDNIQEIHGKLDERKITLSGTLIYGDGKTLMELTKKEGSLVRIENDKPNSAPSFTRKEASSLKGEIVDPKCYFGVMKPGEGKIHKSCGIRCLSGGIAPVFRARNEDDSTRFEYYLILGENGEVINRHLLPFVGRDIKLTGQTSEIHHWKVIYVAVDQLTQTSYYPMPEGITVCQNLSSF